MISYFRTWNDGSAHKTVLLGVILMVTAYFCFSVSNVLIKEISQTYTVAQVLFSRGVIFCLLSSLFVFRGKDRLTLKQTINPSQKLHLILRGAMIAVSLWAIFNGFKVLPFANATVLCFSQIFFMSIFAIPMLKEKVSGKQWIAMTVGFIGVVVAVRPSSDLFDLVHIAPLLVVIAPLLDGIVIMYPRKLVKYHSSNALMFFYAIYSLPFILVLLYLDWVPIAPTLQEVFFFLLQGICSFCGQLFVTHAFRHAPTGVLAPMIFSSFIWGVLFGYIFWGEIPDLWTILGAVLIISAGFYVVRHDPKESQRNIPFE